MEKLLLNFAPGLLVAVLVASFALADPPTVGVQNRVIRSGDTMTGTLTNSIASGSNAIAFSTNGARIDLGDGAADYLDSDGTNIDVAGDLDIEGNDVNGTGTGATFTISSSTADATTSTAVAAVTIISTATLASGDLILEVNDTAGNSRFTVSDTATSDATGTFAMRNTSIGDFTSATTASVMSTTAPAFRFISTAAAADANDLLFGASVNNDGALEFSVDAEGDVFLDGDINSDVTDSTFDITSDTSATTATASVAAITLAPTATLGANDLVVEINSAAGTSLLSVDLEGDVIIGGDINSDATGSFDITSDTTAANMSTTVAAITLAPTATPDSDDLLFEINNAAGTSRFTVDAEGDVVTVGGLLIANNGGAISESGTAAVTVDLASITAGQCSADQAATPNGSMAAGSPCSCSASAALPTGAFCVCNMDGASSAVFKVCCVASAACDPASLTYRLRIFDP